jgi:hypothetical protein
MVKQKLGAVVNAILLEYKEDIVHIEVVGDQGKKSEMTALTLSCNYKVLTKSDQH